MTRRSVPPGVPQPPAGYRVPYECWTLLMQERFSRARADLVVAIWPIVPDVVDVLREVNRLTGPTVTMPQLRSLVENFLTVRRPPGAHRGKRATRPPGEPMSGEDVKAWGDLVELFEDDCHVIHPTPEMQRAVIAAGAALKRMSRVETAAIRLVDMIHTLRETRTDSPDWAPRVRAVFGRDGDPCADLAALIPALAGDPASPSTQANEAPTNE